MIQTIQLRWDRTARPQPHQFGMARMAATHVEIQGMELEIFTDVDEASRFLFGRCGVEGRQNSVIQVRRPAPRPGVSLRRVSLHGR
jgi:hypothetical protein